MSSKKTKSQRTFSLEETQAIGEALARKLKRAKGAAILALTGDLGAGKTTFTQGFFRGLGIKRHAQSPTFIIMRRHAVKKKGFKNIFHIDAYRLKGPEQLAMLGFEEIVADPKNIILIEWADRTKGIIPKSAEWIAFRHGKKENERTITIK